MYTAYTPSQGQMIRESMVTVSVAVGRRHLESNHSWELSCSRPPPPLLLALVLSCLPYPSIAQQKQKRSSSSLQFTLSTPAAPCALALTASVTDTADRHDHLTPRWSRLLEPSIYWSGGVEGRASWGAAQAPDARHRIPCCRMCRRRGSRWLRPSGLRTICHSALRLPAVPCLQPRIRSASPQSHDTRRGT